MAVRPTLAARHEALVEALDLLDALWRVDRDEVTFAGFPRPDVRPPVTLGVNSPQLARLAARRCDGINLRGHAPEMEALLDAARDERSGRLDPWEVSVWTFWDPALLRPDHPERRRFARLGVDRLVLTSLVPLAPSAIAAAAPLLR
jgi:alkanesulfonate monooxygenase SsuD/methylene tetrahydromethanopterin reductase-like flavin-dependent oxidoreductase (luciferase family)